MKKFVAFMFVVLSISALAARVDCAKEKKAIEKDLNKLSSFLEGGYDKVATKSTVPIQMVKEFIVKTHGKEEANEFEFTENAKGYEEGSEAGTTSRGVIWGAVLSTAETWYLEGDDSGKKKAALKKALGEVMSHDFKYGFDASLQGWGGSSASAALFIHTQCKVVYSLFLGITHD